MNFENWIKNYLLENPFSPFQNNSVIAGCNGLYNDPETHYRNSCHWAIVCKFVVSCCECNETERKKFLDFLDRVVNELYSLDLSSGPILARTGKKDKSNGLIGTAWVIESLSYRLSEQSESVREKSEEIIRQLMSHYSFDKKLGYWPNVIEPNGETLGPDRTFNHQLWLTISMLEAACALKDENMKQEAKLFIKALLQHMKFNSNGCIYHTIGAFPHYHRTLAKRILKPDYKKEMHVKELGYHAFNLIALSKLSYLAPELVSNNAKVEKAMDVCKNSAFWSGQANNPYSTPYNPTGLEVAVAASHKDDSGSVINSLNFHFKECFDVNVFKSEFDSPTLNARLYEICFIAEKFRGKLIFQNNNWKLIS